MVRSGLWFLLPRTRVAILWTPFFLFFFFRCGEVTIAMLGPGVPHHSCWPLCVAGLSGAVYGDGVLIELENKKNKNRQKTSETEAIYNGIAYSG